MVVEIVMVDLYPQSPMEELLDSVERPGPVEPEGSDGGRQAREANGH
jgi:hypothetical protein